jgi:cobalt transporter subunit CbtB
MSSTPTLAVVRAAPGTRAGTVLPALLAAALGLVLLAGAGFWQAEAVHNAAHDTRHAAGFPCH